MFVVYVIWCGHFPSLEKDKASTWDEAIDQKSNGKKTGTIERLAAEASGTQHKHGQPRNAAVCASEGCIWQPGKHDRGRILHSHTKLIQSSRRESGFPYWCFD